MAPGISAEAPRSKRHRGEYWPGGLRKHRQRLAYEQVYYGYCDEYVFLG